MVISLALIGCSLLLAVATPWMLGRARWQVFHPHLALTCWLGAFAGGLGLAVTAMLMTVWSAVADLGSHSVWVTVGAWFAVLAIGGTLSAVSGLSQPLVDAHRRAVAALAPVAYAREQRGNITVVRFHGNDPVAVAVPGRQPEVLVSSAMVEALPPDQLDAVLAHEAAHLRGRHGVIVRVAELNEALLPTWAPAGREFLRATRLLVELAADDAAARAVGVRQVAGALSELAGRTGDPSYAVRAQRLTAPRLASRLRRATPEIA